TWQASDAKPTRRIVCHDGDPRCDADGAADGGCSIALRLCVNPPGCAPSVVAGVDLGTDAPPPLAEAVGALPLPVTEAGGCTAPTLLGLERGAGLVIRARARVEARPRDALARVRLRCLAPVGTGRAIVIATDFETGEVATVGMGRSHAVAFPDAPIHSDAIVRAAFGRAYVVNRLLGDNIMVLDPRRGFEPRLECSVDPGSNPHDIALVDPRKAYVTRFGRSGLWVVDPGVSSCERFHRGTIDLGRFADADGLPEMDQMAVVGDQLFVSLERLDSVHQFAPAGRSWLVTIDT